MEPAEYPFEPADFHIRLKRTYNNLHLTLTDPRGRVKAWVNTGLAGFQGSKRTTTMAAQKAARLLAKRAILLRRSRGFYTPAKAWWNPRVDFHLLSQPHWTLLRLVRDLWQAFRVSRSYYNNALHFNARTPHGLLRGRSPRRV
jgi:hypothetical protein